MCAAQASKCQPHFRNGLQSKCYPVLKKKLGNFLITRSNHYPNVKIADDILKLSCICNNFISPFSQKRLEYYTLF